MPLELPTEVADLKMILFAVVLAMPRVAGLLWVLPVMAMAELPQMVRQVVAIALSVPLLPMTYHVASTVDIVPFVWVLTIELVDTQSGYSNLFIFNNIVGSVTGPFGKTATQAGIALFIAVGGLRVAMETMFGSYVVWPIQEAVPRGRLLLEAFAITHIESLFSLTVKLAAPAMLILLIFEVALGLVARFGRQIDVSSVSFAIKALAGLVVLAVLLQFSVEIVGDVAKSAEALSRLLFGNPLPKGTGS
jgi:type III secretory pathway component EscT